MKAPIRIGLPPQLNALFIERWPAGPDYVEHNSTFPQYEMDTIRIIRPYGHWRLPIHTNNDRTLGTFLRLYDNGLIDRITIRENEAEEVVLIKPKDD